MLNFLKKLFERPPQVLRKNGTMDTVETERKITRLSGSERKKCEHEDLTAYLRVDHRDGPGLYADNYEGVVCVDCGAIIDEGEA